MKKFSEKFMDWPHYSKDEIEAVESVLRSGKVNYWTGREGNLFEREFAGMVGTRHAVAVANGTVALELALHSLGIGPGDEVVIPSRTFIATASSVVMRGAVPVVADVDRDSQNITADTLRPQITSRTKAVIAVHLAGWPCDMDPILKLAGEHGLKVIEDCAQAHGATYKGKMVGSFGDASAFSFCQDKIMSTGGEGGMLTTNDPEIWERAWSFKDHGKSYEATHKPEPPVGFNWVHDSFGTNWRLTEMQSAIGRKQLKKLPEWVRARRSNAAALTKCFSRVPGLRVTVPPPEAGHSYYKYYVFIRPEMLNPGWNRDRIMEAIIAEGVPCFNGSCGEIYLEKAFDKIGRRPAERFKVARELGETSLMFLVHPTLTAAELELTCAAVEKVLGSACG